MMWTPDWLDNDRFILQIELAHFGSKLLVDFSTYNTQILCHTGAIISGAHYNDKYSYVQITHTARSSTVLYLYENWKFKFVRGIWSRIPQNFFMCTTIIQYSGVLKTNKK